MILHEGYDEDAYFKDDIALIKLKTPIKFGDPKRKPLSRPICLAGEQFMRNLRKSVSSQDDTLSQDIGVPVTQCIISGWGATKTDHSTKVMQKGMLGLVDTQKCNDRLKEYVSELELRGKNRSVPTTAKEAMLILVKETLAVPWSARFIRTNPSTEDMP